MKRTLRGSTAIITGASAGIGRALAIELDARGLRLVLSARRRDKLDELNASLGGRHVVIVADVSKREDCERLIAESHAALGRIDTLVCNAGYGFYTRVQDSTPEMTRAIFATNVFGTTDCIYAALPILLNQEPRDGWRGQVMIVSSFVARRGIPIVGVYSSTKAAQLSIAEAMRVELAGSQIAVTSVHPIMTKTEFGQVAESQGEVRLPQTDRDRLTQTVEHVARCMAAAIERPQAEVWPSRPSRWVAGLATLFPRLMDRGLAKYYAQLKAANPNSVISS